MARLTDIYQEMEDELMRVYNSQVARGVDTSWSEMKMKELKEYEAYQAAVVRKGSAAAKRAASSGVMTNFKDGARNADSFLKDLVGGDTKLSSSDKWGSFFKINTRKMDALVHAVDSDLDKAEYAILRYTNDMYRQTALKAQFNLASGTMTLQQATDKATRDFLAEGIKSIKYANGARVSPSTYAEMVLRTSNKRAFLSGEGAKQDEWGIHTVQISQYGACSDTCLEWQGRVYIDDVYASGTAKESADSGYPLLSEAIQAGLFHPNCRHTKMPWFEGISSMPKPLDTEQVRTTAARHERSMEIDRNIKKFTALKRGSYDPVNIAKYDAKVKEWRKAKKDLMSYKPKLGPSPIHEVDDIFGTAKKVSAPKVVTPVAIVKTPTPTQTFTSPTEPKVTQLPKTLTQHDKYIELNVKDIKTNLSMNVSKFEAHVKTVESKMKTMIQKCDPTIRIKTWKDFESIANSQFKNQIALAEEGITNKTGGLYSPNRRKQASRQLFGYADQLPGLEMENYGYLSQRNLTDAVKDRGPDQYGEIQIKFKRENIMDRTTFSVGDSLGHDFYPSKLSDPRITSIDSGWGFEDTFDKFLDASNEQLENPRKFAGSYVELQYHGKLTMDDVEAVVVRRNSITVPEKIKDYCNKHNIRLYSVDVNTEDIYDEVSDTIVGKWGILY